MVTEDLRQLQINCTVIAFDTLSAWCDLFIMLPSDNWLLLFWQTFTFN